MMHEYTPDHDDLRTPGRDAFCRVCGLSKQACCGIKPVPRPQYYAEPTLFAFPNVPSVTIEALLVAREVWELERWWRL